MTTLNGGEYPGFHSITVTTGPNGDVITTVDFTQDTRFPSDAPTWTGGRCSHCPQSVHVLDGVVVTARAFHRFDFNPAGDYYADELEAFQ